MPSSILRLYPVLLLFMALIGSSCNANSKGSADTQGSKHHNNTSSNNQTQASPEERYLYAELSAYTQNESTRRYTPKKEHPQVDFLTIHTQRCIGCTRLKNINYFREELILAPNFRDAYIRNIDNQPIYFAAMRVPKPSRSNDPLGPVLTAEFTGGEGFIVVLTIYPKSHEVRAEDVQELLESLVAEVLKQGMR